MVLTHLAIIPTMSERAVNTVGEEKTRSHCADLLGLGCMQQTVSDSAGDDPGEGGRPGTWCRVRLSHCAHPLCSEATKQAAPSRAADLPQELFANIIRHLHISFRDRLIPSMYLRHTGLGSGSLVCLYWAQQCRQVLYQGRNIRIRSMKHAVKFRELVTGAGCKRLKPIVDMIGSVDVRYYGLPKVDFVPLLRG